MIDRLLLNGNIYTFDDDQPRVTALAIIGETIVAAGSDDDLRHLAGRNTQIDDLQGRFVMPGLVDAHLHWENTAKYRHAVSLYNVASKAEALQRIEARAQSTPPGMWIFGSGWAQYEWAGGAFPTREDLDRVTGAIPTYLSAKSGHAAWVNSAALQAAGIDAQTPDPPGGKISRDASGEPDGILLEAPAMSLVSQQMPSITPDLLTEWMRDLQEDAWRVGLVGVHDFDNPSCMVALQLLRERGQSGIRVLKQINDPYIEHAHELGIRSGFGDDWLRFGSLKIFADGALGPRTAAMIAPYENEPENYGVVVMDKESMYELVSRASQLGIASTVHAIGDRAVHDVLDVYEAVRGEEAERGIPRSARRHRIEHVQIIHPDDIKRLGQLGVIASMQPIHAISDMEMADRFWGDRAQYSYQWRAQVQAGAGLVFGSDSPIDPFDTFRGIHAAVTRRRPDRAYGGDGWYPDARLTMEETLHAYTTGPAYAAGTEDHSGRLKRGYLADVVVMDQNLFEIEPDAILETNVLGTMIGGKWRYRTF